MLSTCIGQGSCIYRRVAMERACTRDEKRDTGCGMQYMTQIVAQRPDFYEGQIKFARASGWSQKDGARSALKRQEILTENPPPPIELQILGGGHRLLHEVLLSLGTWPWSELPVPHLTPSEREYSMIDSFRFTK